MKGFLATLLFLGTVDVQAAADESQAIAGIVANMVKPAALNAVRTSKALDVTTPEVGHSLDYNTAIVVVGCGDPLFLGIMPSTEEQGTPMDMTQSFISQLILLMMYPPLPIRPSPSVLAALSTRTTQDADDECPTERSACMSNSQCVSCFLAFSTVGCDDSPSDCGELGSSYCCMFTGTDAECGENAALIAYTGELFFERFICMFSSLYPTPTFDVL